MVLRDSLEVALEHASRIPENVGAAGLVLDQAALDRLEALSPLGGWAGETSQFGALQTSPQPASS